MNEKYYQNIYETNCEENNNRMLGKKKITYPFYNLLIYRMIKGNRDKINYLLKLRAGI